MALVKKTKLNPFEVRSYKMDNNIAGQVYEGYIVKAYEEGDKFVQFTSPTPVKEQDVSGYDEATAIEVQLYGRTFKDQVKWSTDKKVDTKAR